LNQSFTQLNIPMQTSNEQGAIVHQATVEIAPIYQKAIAQTASHYQVMVAFVKAQMQKDIDYGVIPGTSKPTLLKPGAEKLCRLFNLRPSYELIQSVADFDPTFRRFLNKENNIFDNPSRGTAKCVFVNRST
jgi:hypothetical protein